MSTIVVVRKNDTAVIAADSLFSFGDTKVTSKYVRNREKILKFGDTFLGVAGSTAHHNVLENLFRRHKRDLSFAGEREIFQTYLKMHTILKDEYFVNTKEDDDENVYESSQIDALIANPSGIFGMYAWRDVFEFERFYALGSGTDYALGALHAVYDNLETPEDIAAAALNAACEFDNGSGLPFTIRSIKIANHKSNRQK